MVPPIPSFGALRLARLADLSRISVVAAAGFFYSSWWPYERLYANSYPNDTLASYRNMYRKAIFDPNVVVLVVEDSLDKNEIDSVYDSLAKVYPDWEHQIPLESLKAGKAVVGITSLALLPDSPRSGQFLPDDMLLTNLSKLSSLTALSGLAPKDPETPGLKDRDRNAQASKLFHDAVHPREKE